MYVSLSGIEEPGRYLDDQIVKHLEEVHALLENQAGMSTREAIERVLGTFTEAVPPAIALSIDQRLTTLEAGQARLEELVMEMVGYMRDAQKRRAGQTQHIQEDALSLAGQRNLEHQVG
jgi:hypothetical protein